jgi:hypothetical protein
VWTIKYEKPDSFDATRDAALMESLRLELQQMGRLM